jgi:hypothetical protein
MKHIERQTVHMECVSSWSLYFVSDMRKLAAKAPIALSELLHTSEDKLNSRRRRLDTVAQCVAVLVCAWRQPRRDI